MSARCFCLCILPLSLFMLAEAGDAGAAARIESKLSALLARSAPPAEVPVIITMADKIGEKEFPGKNRGERRARQIKALRMKAEQSQQGVRRLLSARGAKEMKRLWVINSVAAIVTPATVAELASLPGVAEIRLDRTLNEPVTPFGAASSTPAWNLAAVGAPSLWKQGVIGQGVVVAILDSGVDPSHPDIGPKWRGGANSWFDPHDENPLPNDVSGHGTRVAGLIVGGEASGVPVGMAPGARWIGAKIFSNRGVTSYSAIHRSFQWALDPDGNPEVDDAPDIVNNSWGLRETLGRCDTEFSEDIAALRAAGIGVVFAAGNDGPFFGTSISPANNQGSIAVGALDATLAVDYAGSRGPSACDGGFYPHVVAPGVGVLTTDLTYGGLIRHSYVEAHGSSFAAPHVSGGIALLLSAFPAARAADIEDAVKRSALDLGDAGPDHVYGFGLLDLAAAFDLLAAKPVDSDGDGFFADVDCNDGDGTIHPDAVETKHDGIDQDCNGLDLTIDVNAARYSRSRQKLVVLATSALGAQAGLEALITMDNGGEVSIEMSWNGRRRSWQLVMAGFQEMFGGRPARVAVRGVEGVSERGVLVSR